MERRGEKIGWLAGWMGGFIWVAILALVFLVKGQWVQSVIGFGVVVVAWLCVWHLAPWRHPRTPYWKLMLGPYAVFWGSAAWAVWAYGGLEQVGLSGWSLLWLLPLLMPFGIVGRRCWDDSDPKGSGGNKI